MFPDNMADSERTDWSRFETRTLINIWKYYSHLLETSKVKKHIYEDITKQLHEMGFRRSHEQVRRKINRIKAVYYKHKMENTSTDWEYFDVIDEFMGQNLTYEYNTPYNNEEEETMSTQESPVMLVEDMAYHQFQESLGEPEIETVVLSPDPPVADESEHEIQELEEADGEEEPYGGTSQYLKRKKKRLVNTEKDLLVMHRKSLEALEEWEERNYQELVTLNQTVQQMSEHFAAISKAMEAMIGAQRPTEERPPVIPQMQMITQR